MNSRDLMLKLDGLELQVWQGLLDGKALRLVDDSVLELAEPGQRNLIFFEPDAQGMDLDGLRARVMSKVDELIDEYYLRNPLSLKAFNRQVQGLIQEHGAAAFVAEYGDLPERSLFVEVGDVLALDAESPQHRYGAFCELDEPVNEQDIKKLVKAWLDSNEAYEKYISMNVCRYSC